MTTLKVSKGDKCIIHSVNNLNKRRMCATEGTSREWRRKIFSNMKLFYYYGWAIGTGGYLMSIKDTI